ncbi:MAG: DUF167 family protein [Symbiopectobacterium sp.]
MRIALSPDGLTFGSIQPKVSRDQIVSLHDNELKVASTAPPIVSQANAHLGKYLAKHFQMAKCAVNIEKCELGPALNRFVNPQR